VNRAAVRDPHVRQNFADKMSAAHRRCQFMGGKEIGPMCGKASVPHYSYCKKHKAICYMARGTKGSAITNVPTNNLAPK
tara:strand:- start:347 stop:583 length:237 start_codon:yes stop_codon:yes gene_type:complete